MRSVFGAFVALFVVSAPPAAAQAPAAKAPAAKEMGASVSAPFRHDIDARCDRLDATPAQSWVHFQRLDAKHGATARWTPQVSGTPKAGAAASGDETLDPGTYAHVVRKNGRVVYARLAVLKPGGELGATDTYCYAGDGLIRLRSEQVVAGTTGTLTRTKYYDGGKLLTHTEQKANFSDDDRGKAASVPDRTPVYMQPSTLPFYAVMMKNAAQARART